MLFEKHAIDAARGFARHFFGGLYPVARAFEAFTRRPFPKFRPHPLWYQQPTYYFGNHNTFVADQQNVAWPMYSTFFDYELEIGAILAHPLHNATADEAATAIGGFVVLNDFSARDVQLDEMRSGFGPQKAKHFCSSMSAEVITADELLPHLQTLEGGVNINGTCVSNVSSRSPQFSLEEAIAFTSRSEHLVPGELFGSGTLPGGSGIENGSRVALGDKLTLHIKGVAQLSNTIIKAGSACT
ncbi:MAG: fumarylacetoacetate hydrolase family protein [Sandaracinaceae bacterium]